MGGGECLFHGQLSGLRANQSNPQSEGERETERDLIRLLPSLILGLGQNLRYVYEMLEGF